MGAGFGRRARVAVAGAGRLGSSLAIALRETGLIVASVSSRRAEHRRWLASRLPGAAVVRTAAAAAEQADVVLITVPDDEIAGVCERIDWRPDQAAVHCAGAVGLAALRAAEGVGAAIGGFHPLQTFPRPGEPDRFVGVTFAIEAEHAGLAAWLRRVAETLGGLPLQIRSADRALYHAGATLACAMVTALLGLAAELWGKLGTERGEALDRLLPLVRSTLDGIGEQALPAALTGPHARGDVSTVRAHLEALRRRAPEAAAVYVELSRVALRIAAERNAISGGVLEDMRRALAMPPGGDEER